LPLVRVIATGCLWAAGALGSATADAQARSEAIARAVHYCTSKPPNSYGHLSEDRSILCFDGSVGENLDLTPLSGLREDGFFVIRSFGGSAETAMQIADGLREKNATVVVRDYCWSACANWILIATNQTHVLANAIIAWHGGVGDCADADIANSQRRFNRPCSSPWGQSRNFFAKRGIDQRHTFKPQTRYSKQIFLAALQGAFEKRSVFWTWHPKNHGDYFKGRIKYESFPDEDAVDAFMRQFRGQVRIIYDPER
jgi:hypothetical protein